jgi:hypothetical protein
MTTLFEYALLSMDAYSRGYTVWSNGTDGSGQRSDLSGTLVGSAEIIWSSKELRDDGDPPMREDKPNSFYAIAYRIDGKIVLAFRGTDQPTGPNNDGQTGWDLGGGDFTAIQATLAIRAYQAVAQLAGPSGPSRWSRCCPGTRAADLQIIRPLVKEYHREPVRTYCLLRAQASAPRKTGHQQSRYDAGWLCALPRSPGRHRSCQRRRLLPWRK